MTKYTINFFSFAVLFFASSLNLASAAQTCSGNWSNVNKSQDVLDLGEGVTLTTNVHRGTLTSANSKQQGTGGCSDIVLTFPDGSVKMFYACARKGENGVFVDYGELKPGEGAPKGVWNIEKGFGTGDYKNLTAKGTWEMLLSDGKSTVGSFKGKCTY